VKQTGVAAQNYTMRESDSHCDGYIGVTPFSLVDRYQHLDGTWYFATSIFRGKFVLIHQITRLRIQEDSSLELGLTDVVKNKEILCVMYMKKY
jgi:hypothetical protein